MKATRMASAKIRAKAKGTLGLLLKSLEIGAFDELREGFARRADWAAMVFLVVDWPLLLRCSVAIAESIHYTASWKRMGRFAPFQ